MNPPMILAHGALGSWDELIFLSVAAIFFIVMGVAWVRSRALQPEADEELLAETPTADNTPSDSPDHFTLD